MGYTRCTRRTFAGILLVVTLSSCSPAQPTSLPINTSLPPTSTEISVPESTVTSTASPTLAASPTAALDPQDFYGTWTIFDREAGGPNFLTFNADGTLTATHGPNQSQSLHQGTYQLEGNELTFVNWWYCEPEQQTGVYRIQLYPDKQSVRFFPVDDPCEERVYDFTNRIIKWNRFVPTPTPSP